MSRTQFEATSAPLQNPKSILLDRNYNPIEKPVASASVESETSRDSAARVTFAKGAITAKICGLVASGSGSASAYQSPQRYSRDEHPSSSYFRVKPVNYVDKYNFGLLQSDNKRKMESGNVGDRTDFEKENGSVKLNQKPLKSVSILYPLDTASRYKANFNCAASTGELLPRGEFDENAGGASKSTVKSNTKSTSRTKSRKTRATTRSFISTIPRRKSGKKLKKRKKSKLPQLDKELESLQPAKLDDEYATELHKISQILKAVSAYDEFTDIEQGEDYYLPSSEHNIVTQSIHRRNRVGVGHVRRPLSEEEVKKLLSSITRVVSLHHLPISLSSLRISTNATPGTMGLKTAPHPQSFQEESSSLPKTPEGFNVNLLVPEKTSSSNEKSKKKSRKASRRSSKSTQPRASGPSLRKPKSTIRPIAIAPANSTFKGRSSTSYPNKPRPKSRSRRRSKSASKKRSNESIMSSMERDPVKNAQFLQMYFEESTSLANKRSSDELIL